MKIDDKNMISTYFNQVEPDPWGDTTIPERIFVLGFIVGVVYAVARLGRKAISYVH